MEGITVIPKYSPPEVTDLGTFSALTAVSFDGGLHFAQVPIGSLGGESPTPPANPVAPTPTETPAPAGDVESGGQSAPADVPADVDVRNNTASGGPTSGTGDSGGSGGGGGGGTPSSQTLGASASGDSLPSTGFASGIMGAVGAAITATGVTLRRLTRSR